MPYGEAVRLTALLAADPSSHVAAALGGWAHPIARADITLRDLYDLQYASKARHRPPPYPRPWDKQPARVGDGTSMSVEQYRAMRASLTEPNVGGSQ